VGNIYRLLIFHSLVALQRLVWDGLLLPWLLKLLLALRI